MRASGATYAQIKAEVGIGASTISRILGVYGQGRAKPRVTDDVKERARAFCRDGRSVPEIATELGLAKSTAWLITKDTPWLPEADRVERKARAARSGWQDRNRRNAVARQRQKLAWAQHVDHLTDRELLLVGAAIYWAEGGKDKPWRRSEHLLFVNSDPTVIVMFLRWLELLGVDPGRRTFRLQIHETADIGGALQFWSEVTSVPVAEFQDHHGEATQTADQPAQHRPPLPWLSRHLRQAFRARIPCCGGTLGGASQGCSDPDWPGSADARRSGTVDVAPRWM